MQHYQFTCPLDGCNKSMKVSADNDHDAATKLTTIAKEHVGELHTDIQRTDAQIYQDMISGMEIVEEDAHASVM